MREQNLRFRMAEGREIPKKAILEHLHSKIDSFYKRQVGITKQEVLDAIDNRDITSLRWISRRAATLSSGIYSRLLWYMALLPTYDCVTDPYLKFDGAMADYSDEINVVMRKAMKFIDKLRLHNVAPYLAYEVLVDGVCYRLKRETEDSVVLQELPLKYCRTRYQINNKDIIEFNVRYFDTIYDTVERTMILQSMPAIFRHEYERYRNNKLRIDPKDRGAWFALPPEMGEVFYLTKDHFPFFVKVLPDILDWEAIKDINLVKAEQELSKILVQKFGFNKNGQLLFELGEIGQLHENALGMIGDIEGLDVLTTFADVEVLDLQQKSGFNQSNDPLRNFLNSIYATAGISSNLFATDGNLALDKSIANDEAIMMLFVEKIQAFLNYEISRRFETKNIGLICNFPRITIYNFKDMADVFKGQAMYGYSKRLPAIATGQTQSSLMAAIEYENSVLGMAEIMQPLQSSATQSSKNAADDVKNGRPSLPDDQKSDKTIQNLESSK